MEGTEEKEFYRSARAWGRRQAHNLGLGDDHCIECADTFVVKLSQAASEPAWWTWPPEQVEAFLHTSARNHALNYRRDLISIGNRTAQDMPGEVGGECAEFPSRDGDPDAPQMLCLFWDKVEAALALLSKDQRRLLVDYHVRSITVELIAELLQCEVTAVRQRLVRARKQLQKALAATGSSEVELRSCIAAACRGQEAVAT